MLVAVSILSPVRTHTLMPPPLANVIVSATSSQSLSSMAVEPINSISISIFSSTSATFSSLWQIASLAWFDSSFHVVHSFLGISFCERYSVLRPSLANYVTTLSVSLKISLFKDTELSLSQMTESAPLHMSQIFFSLSSTMTDILFLVEVKAQTLRSLYLTAPFGVLIVMTSSPSLPANS